MSYPYIGMPMIVPGDKWDAKTVEELLRGGHHIFFEDAQGPIGTAKFEGGEFMFIGDQDLRNFPDSDEKDIRRFGSDSFLEFAAWCAFSGRSFL